MSVPTPGAGTRPLQGVTVCCSLISPWPERNARAVKIADSLAAAGADVSVVYLASRDGCLPSGSFRAVRIRPTEIRASEHPNWLLRVMYNVLAALPLMALVRVLQAYGLDPKLLAALMRERADIYHAHVLDTALPAYLVTRLRRRARVVYDVRDLFVESRGAFLTNRQKAYWRWVERFLSRRVDLILSVSRAMGDVVASGSRGLARIEVVLNGPWECVGNAGLRGGPARLFFQGYYSENRNLAELIMAMQDLKSHATLTLQGWGECESELRGLVDELGLHEYVTFLAPCAPREVIRCAREYDVGVICYRGITRNLQTTIPNKLLDYIGAGLAIAGSDLPGVRSIIDPYGCGEPIDPTSAETIAFGLRRMISDPVRLQRMKEASARACAELCWDRQAEHLVALYAEMLWGAGADRE